MVPQGTRPAEEMQVSTVTTDPGYTCIVNTDSTVYNTFLPAMRDHLSFTPSVSNNRFYCISTTAVQVLAY